MLKIKLTRLGKKAEPRYRIVVNEARDKRDGRYVAQLGYYQPSLQPKRLVLDLKAYEQWLARGAQPTSTVAFLYGVAKAGKGFPEGKAKLSKKAKEKLKAAQAEKVAPQAETKVTTTSPAAATPVATTTKTKAEEKSATNTKETKTDTAPAEAEVKEKK